MSFKIISFELGREIYGIDIKDAGEIFKVPEITPVPNTKNYIEGVINLRGNIVPVINLSKKFALKESIKRGKENKVIVIEDKEEFVGVLVDNVRAVRRIDEANIEEAPKLSTGMPREFYKGVINIEGKMTILLDILKVLGIGNEEA